MKMTMVLDWSSLRAFGGSQNSAFEELCCQLAGHEEMPAGSRFIRKAAPDAGIECYWVLPDGSEHGWQAKFFRARPEDAQWSQLDESVAQALKKHPRLKKYIVCMPMDRQDPRKENQEWFMDKWQERVEKWSARAGTQGMAVEFGYWGQHEIVDRLTKEEHRGRLLFWFNRDTLSARRMRNQIDDVIANVGPRYTRDLNVELDIARTFEIIGRTEAFHNEVKKTIGPLRKELERIETRDGEATFGGILDKIRDGGRAIVEGFRYFAECAVNRIDLKETTSLLDSVVELCWDCERTAHDAEEQERASHKERSDLSEHLGNDRSYGYVVQSCRATKNALYELYRYVNESEARLAVNPAMVLTGSAGVGKTHLLCDVAKRRSERNLPTALLLGQNFGTGDLWHQMIDQLQFNCETRDEFLGILDAAGEATGARALILIDAINESDAKEAWRNNLAAVLNAVRRYPWVGIVVSVRESYFRYMIPQHLYEKNEVIVVLHRGFSGEEFKAAKAFFDYYQIEYPSVPLLHPEFSNPQFLGLLCKGLHNRGMHKIPRGAHGVTWVYGWLVDSVNEKLSRADHLNYDPRDEIIQRAVSSLAGRMSQECQNWLELSAAKVVVDAVLPPAGYHGSLFDSLISEGVIAEDLHWSETDHVTIVRFAYERFSDHLIIRFMLEQHPAQTPPERLIDLGQPIASLCADEQTCWSNRGLVDALSIQLPERLGRELVSLVPEAADWLPMQQAFLDSLIWREPAAITESARKYFGEHIAGNPDVQAELLETLLTVAVVPDHPFNADFLHTTLMPRTLPERDASWSIATFRSYGQRGAIDRLIDWAWSRDDKAHIDDESIRLAAVTISWFLTSSHRFLRDHATKALVALLTDRILVLRAVLKLLHEVNDPYVSERLYAIAYGCAMRTQDKAGIAALARDVYDLVFKDGAPPPNISLRDYARGVVELALQRDPNLGIDARKVRPPYRSEWSDDIPSLEPLKASLKLEQEKRSDEEWAQWHLVFSVTEDDFQRYVIRSAFGWHNWTSYRIGLPREKTNREIYDDFVASFRSDQREAWERLERVRSRVQRLGTPLQVSEGGVLHLLFSGSKSAVFHNALAQAEKEFTGRLAPDRQTLFDEKIKRFIEDSHVLNERDWFDLSVATAFILNRAFTLGWDRHLFGKFDADVVNHERVGRDAHKPERIGKKYQWIAFRELLARVSDNFEYVGGYGDKPERYEGAWQLSDARDIDPSCIISRKKTEGTSRNVWETRVTYTQWGVPVDETAWLESTTDLPAVDSLVGMRDQAGTSWLVLESHQTWEQPTPPEEEHYGVATRRLWLTLSSYLVRKGEAGLFVEWARKQDFGGDWMPRSDHSLYLFLGEFFWSPAFKYFDTPYYSRTGWTRGSRGSREPPCEVLVTTDEYFTEPGYDCSIRDAFTILLPCRTIVGEMGLSWNGREGKWFAADGKLMALDPSVEDGGPRALQVRKETFERYLQEKGYEVVWIVAGGKDVLGGGLSRQERHGLLRISGAARLENDQIVSHLNGQFDPPYGKS
jgi:hypothetical protein